MTVTLSRNLRIHSRASIRTSAFSIADLKGLVGIGIPAFVKTVYCKTPLGGVNEGQIHQFAVCISLFLTPLLRTVPIRWRHAGGSNRENCLQRHSGPIQFLFRSFYPWIVRRF